MKRSFIKMENGKLKETFGPWNWSKEEIKRFMKKKKGPFDFTYNDNDLLWCGQPFNRVVRVKRGMWDRYEAWGLEDGSWFSSLPAEWLSPITQAQKNRALAGELVLWKYHQIKGIGASIWNLFTMWRRKVYGS